MGNSRRKVIVRDVDFRAARYIAEASVRFGPNEIGNRIGRAAFDIRKGVSLPFTLEDEEYAEITDHDGVSLRFTGKTKMLNRERVLSVTSGLSQRTVECQDWAAEMDRLNVTADFNVTAGDNDRDIVEQLLAIYWPQISTQAGLTHIVNARRVNMPAIAVVQGSKSLRQALDDIAAAAFNATWYVDAYKRVHWNDTLNVAPFVVIDDPTLFGSPDWVGVLLGAGASSFWPLTEPYGTVLGDSYGVASLTPSGVYTLGQRSLVAAPGGAITLGGGSLSAGSVYNEDGVKSFSFGMWCSPSTIDATVRRLVSREVTDGGGRQGWEVGHSTAGVIVERCRDGAVGSTTYATPLVAGRRYFVSATYDGANLRLSVNGALVAGPTASAQSIKVFAGNLVIGAHSAGGSNFVGDVDEPAVADGIVWTQAQQAAMYAAGSRKFVGFARLNDQLDGTAKAVRVVVIGTGGNDTVTDWPEYARLRRKTAYERGAPNPRVPQLNDVTDMNLTTSARRIQRGYQELDAVKRRRTLPLSVYDHGLIPGQQLDLIDYATGTGAEPYASSDDAALFGVSDAGVLHKGKGRFFVQRVTPVDRGGENWEYDVEVGAYLPTFEQAVGG